MGSLRSLEGSPKYVGKTFYIQGANLTDLIGMPSKVDGQVRIKDSMMPEVYAGLNCNGVSVPSELLPASQCVITAKNPRDAGTPFRI